MMIFFTIVMVIWLYVSFLIGVTAINFNALKAEDKLTGDAEKSASLVIGCIGLPIVISHTLAQVIYYFNALTIDTYFYPTLVMTVLFGLSLLRTIYIVAFTKNEPKTKVPLVAKFSVSLSTIYYIYMLFVLIVLI